MKLYIANVTTQLQIVNFRLDFRPDGARDDRIVIPPRATPPIPPGRQMPVGGDLANMDAANSIIAQLVPYGLVMQMEIGKLPRREKITYVANVDREVSAEAIRAAHAHNTGVKIEDGALRRRRAAVAASDIVAKTVEEQSAQNGLNAPMTGFDVSIEQEEQSEAGERRIEEGYRVDVSGEAAPGGPPGGKPGRGRGRRAA